MKTSLIAEIAATMDELTGSIKAFDQHQIDTVPFEGSWTAGQVAEHIIKSISNLPDFFAANVAPTTTRLPDANVGTLRNIFLDFNTKMQSPEFILPGASNHGKAALLQSVDELKTQMINAVNTLDLTLTCNTLEMPGLGFLTRTEWLNFFIVHTQRHTHQLNNIYKAINER